MFNYYLQQQLFTSTVVIAAALVQTPHRRYIGHNLYYYEKFKAGSTSSVTFRNVFQVRKKGRKEERLLGTPMHASSIFRCAETPCPRLLSLVDTLGFGALFLYALNRLYRDLWRTELMKIKLYRHRLNNKNSPTFFDQL